MFRKLALSVALAMTLIGGSVGVSPASHAPALAAAQAAPAAALAAAAYTQAPTAVQLSGVQLAAVQGAGFWSSIWKAVVSVVVKVAGAILTSWVKAITDWMTQVLSGTTGGEKKEKNDKEVKAYASQADYNAGIVSSEYTEAGSWVQTEVWYGGGGCDGGSTDNVLQNYAEVGVDTVC